MMLTRKKRPIGIQTFADIREGGYYYADKSGYAVDLAERGKYYFLSRPRRFGKSLFLDTLKELFENNEKIFQGLHAEKRWDWSQKYPVIRISFGTGIHKTKAAFTGRVQEILHNNRERLGIECPTELPANDVASHLSELIKQAHEKNGQRVVVLIDEYDKPILDNITDVVIATEMREGLKDLYSVFKDSDEHLKFVFITGVSKFSKVSLFSGLNNLQDITLDKRYSAICGYTDEDIDTVFKPELFELDREEIRDWYNGYNWLGEGVYNPFDILLLFEKREFNNYWFESGTPTFLIKLLSERQQFTPELEQLVAPEMLLSTFEVDHIPIEALMFQTGYLTIDHIERLPGLTQVSLRYPNREVRASLNGVLLQQLMQSDTQYGKNASRLYALLRINDWIGLKSLFHAFFASIPNDWYRKNRISEFEGYYASIFYSHFAALGLDIHLEDVTNRGRIDMTVLFNHHVYIFEFKVVESNPEGNALAQIKERAYADKYRARCEPIHLIGVEFSKDHRNIVGFEIENV